MLAACEGPGRRGALGSRALNAGIDGSHQGVGVAHYWQGSRSLTALPRSEKPAPDMMNVVFTERQRCRCRLQ